MRYRITPLLTLSALALVACGPGEEAQYEPGTSGEEPAEVRETPMPDYTETLESDFTATEAADADVTGTLRLMEPTSVAPPGAPMRIAVQVSGLSPGDHAWDIHAGPCGAEGDVVVPITATAEREGVGEPLHPDDRGVAEAEVDVPALSERWAGIGDHSVHIHREAGEEHGPGVACATL